MMIDKLSPTLSCLLMIPTINSTHPHHTSDSTQFGALQTLSYTPKRILKGRVEEDNINKKSKLYLDFTQNSMVILLLQKILNFVQGRL